MYIVGKQFCSHISLISVTNPLSLSLSLTPSHTKALSSILSLSVTHTHSLTCVTYSTVQSGFGVGPVGAGVGLVVGTGVGLLIGTGAIVGDLLSENNPAKEREQ